MNIIDKLKEILGESGVLTGKDVSERTVSVFNPAPCSAKAIVRPRSTDDVIKIVTLCNAEKQPLVPAGGKTGLVDGVNCNPDEIQISFELMNAIEEVDTINRTMTVQAGATMQAVQEAARDAGFLYPVDLGGRGSATIGGNIATNAGGNTVLRYGMTREQILGLEVVMADGTQLSSLSKLIKNNAGYDLNQLFIGSEGTLGIVTRAVLRLRPQTTSQNTAFVALDAFKKIPELLNTLQTSLGEQLSSFEVMWSDFYQSVMSSGKHQSPLSEETPYYVLIECEGSSAEKDAEVFQEVLGNLLENEVIADAALAESVAQREALWAIRDDIETIQHGLPKGLAFDISLPLDHIEQYVDDVKASLAAQDPDYKIATFGHLGDNNVHLGISINPEINDYRTKIMQAVYVPLQKYQGSISAEHGIGLEKKNYLKHSRSEEYINLIRTLKMSLDPHCILNPGKVIDLKS